MSTNSIKNNNGDNNNEGENDDENKNERKEKEKRSLLCCNNCRTGKSNSKCVAGQKHKHCSLCGPHQEISRAAEVSTSSRSLRRIVQFRIIAKYFFDRTDNESDELTQPVLKNFTSQIHRSCPRAATTKPCFQELRVYEDLESQSLINMVSSSKQLVEILKNSPTHSEANLKLLNSSYLRKLEGVQEAIRNGADVNVFCDRESPLVIASELGDDCLVSYLLTVPDIDVNFRNIFGETPLLIAVRNTFNKIVKLLLNYNADVNVTDNMGKNPLHIALFQQRPHMARLLLAYGADYDEWDVFGERPIYTSVVKKPHLECVTLLLNVGASPEYRGFSGMPLISRAIMNWTNFKIIETLVRYGASVNAKDSFSGKTPLHYAAIINDINITNFLIKRGADPNIKTVFNVTPYEEALSHRSIIVAQFLANLTLNPNLRKLSIMIHKGSSGSQGSQEIRPTVINVPSKTQPPKTKKKKKEKKK